MNKIIARAKSPTPVFFKKIRNISITLTAIAGIILTAPIALPAAIVTGAGYIAVAGGIASAICQLTTGGSPASMELENQTSSISSPNTAEDDNP